jgi:hypothetical protein
MADEQSPISDTPNLADAQTLQEIHNQFQRAEASRQAGATASRGAGATGGAGENVTENPRWDLDGRMIAQMELQTNALLAAIMALTAAQGAAAAAQAPPAAAPAAPPAAQGVQMAQNTQELSLTTPVLFYRKCKDGKSIPPNAFLMELKARQTRHGWEPSMLLRFVKSCLRGEAALWWEGCILSYGDDQDQGPADNYVAFKIAFKQHYAIGGATNNLCWADTFCQRSDEDIREYFSRSTAELGNHLKESAPLLYGKAYTPVNISVNVKNTLKRLRMSQKRGQDLGLASMRDELERCARDITAQKTKVAKRRAEEVQEELSQFLDIPGHHADNLKGRNKVVRG